MPRHQGPGSYGNLIGLKVSDDMLALIEAARSNEPVQDFLRALIATAIQVPVRWTDWEQRAREAERRLALADETLVRDADFIPGTTWYSPALAEVFFVTLRQKAGGKVVCPTKACREGHLATGADGDHSRAGLIVNLTGSRGSWKVPKTAGRLIQVHIFPVEQCRGM